jgi:choline dehydrogenase-like flavoprotein
MTEPGADDVEVGVGSAGCVVADRLSEDGARVVLLEADPRSRHPLIHVPAGALRLRTEIRPNYLSAPEDLRALLAGIEIARRIFAAVPLARHSAAETLPGPETQSPAALARFVVAVGVNRHHAVGICKMGEDPTAVVDSRLLVRHRRVARR